MVKTIFLNSVSNKKQTTVIDICYLHQPKQKYKQLDARLDIFDALEKFNGSKLPECVKTILKHSAYDSAETLGLLDGIHVSEIEMYINETDHSVIDNLSCCNSSTYQNQQQFRFLPGHKGIILAIPAQISKMKAAKNTRGQRSLEFKKMLTKAELLELLLKKLNNFFSKAGWTTHSLFTEAHLSSFQMRISDNAMTAQCNVKCVHCSAESLSVYRNSWGISNIIRHLKTHLNKMAEAPTSKEGRNLSKDCQNSPFTIENGSDELKLLAEAGKISSDELIEEEVIVEVFDHNAGDNVENDHLKSVPLGCGQSIDFKMIIKP